MALTLSPLPGTLVLKVQGPERVSAGLCGKIMETPGAALEPGDIASWFRAPVSRESVRTRVRAGADHFSGRFGEAPSLSFPPAPHLPPPPGFLAIPDALRSLLAPTARRIASGPSAHQPHSIYGPTPPDTGNHCPEKPCSKAARTPVPPPSTSGCVHDAGATFRNAPENRTSTSIDPGEPLMMKKICQSD